MKICYHIQLLSALASLLTFSSVDAAQSQKKLKFSQDMQNHIQHKNYKRLDGVLKKSATKKKTLATIKHAAKSSNHPELVSAIRANNRLQTKKYGMDQGNFLKTAYFIETRLPKIVKKKNYYITKKKSGLSNNLEHDPSRKATFIILEGKKAQLGKGKKKLVTKAIYYNDAHPEIVARGEQSVPMKRELQVTKKLQSKPGLFQTYGFGKHKAHGKKYTTIYSKLYSPGSLHSALEDKTKFSIYEKIKIAKDIVRGLHSLHKRGLVHRDLGARNYLINIPKGKRGKRNIEACIADLGRTDYTKNVKDSKVQGNTSYTAPEALYRSKLSKKDYFKTDTYAVGCVLYWLFHEKRARWQDMSYVKDTKRPLKTRYHELVHRILKATDSRRKSLDKKKHLSPKAELEAVILNMVDPYPAKRKSAAQLSKRLDALFKRVKKK